MSKASIQLSDHFTCGRLIQFTLPSITMMIFTAVYGVVDGFFVSNYAGKTPFAAVNLIIPVLLGLGCVGFMFGTGGGALIAKTMGQGDRERANDIFSMIVYVSAAIGVVLARTLLQGKRTRWQQSPFLLTASKSVPEDEESEKKD